MLVAMLLVAVMAWGVVEAVNKYREDEYNQKMLVGTFWAVANGTGTYLEHKNS